MPRPAGKHSAVELPQESSSQRPCATRSWGHMGALSWGEGNGLQCWGAIWIYAQTWPLKDSRGQAATGMGCPVYPSCYPRGGQQNPREARPPWTADSIPHPWLWRLAPQGNFKRQDKQQGTDTCAQIPLELPLLRCCLPSPAAIQIQLRSRTITPQAPCRRNIHLAIYMIRNVKRLSVSSLRTAALAISSVKYFQNPKVLREKSSYFD